MIRWYQQKALDEIRAHFAAGTKKALLHAATGSGKTVIFCEVLKGVHAKGKHAIIVARGKALIDQASQRLFREGVPHGCIQAHHWNHRPLERIQVCSIDTLHRRSALPPADLVVIDEAHLATSSAFRRLVAAYPNAFFLAVSATPHAPGGLSHIADVVVHPISIGQLMDEDYLARPIYYAPTHVNLGGVQVDRKTGDYNAFQLGQAVERSAIYGDVPRHYKQLADGQPAVLFAVNVKHSLEFVERFKAAGIAAAHIDAETPKAQREKCLEDLEAGRIQVVSNVGILTTGVDLPFLKVVILARPTRSYNLFIQMIGRCTRIVPGKKTFLVLDHANNVETHGFIENERKCDLTGKRKRASAIDEERKPRLCLKCYAMFRQIKGVSKCPLCNAPLETRAANRDAVEEGGELIQVSFQAANKYAGQINIAGLVRQAVERNYKLGWVYHHVKERYGKEHAQILWKEIRSEFGKYKKDP